MRREDAERYLALTLVSFAATVIATRWFLQLTGFPKIGGGDLHIAHALFGGLLLFVAALLPIVMAGRSVYQAAAVVSASGSVCSSTRSGSSSPARTTTSPGRGADHLRHVPPRRARLAAPPTPGGRRPADGLLGALELLEESVEGDLQPRERDELFEKLRAALVADGRSSAVSPTRCSSSSSRARSSSLPTCRHRSSGCARGEPPGAIAGSVARPAARHRRRSPRLRRGRGRRPARHRRQGRQRRHATGQPIFALRSRSCSSRAWRACCSSPARCLSLRLGGTDSAEPRLLRLLVVLVLGTSSRSTSAVRLDLAMLLHVLLLVAVVGYRRELESERDAPASSGAATA